MAINFPTSLDTLTNPTSSDKVGVLIHSAQHSDLNDIVEALEAKVGINGSAVTTSHDYKLGEVTGSDKAVGKSATQTLTNKTLTAPKIADTGSINDTNNNEFIKFNMTASAVNELAVTNGATGNAPRLSASGDDTNIDLSLRGKGTGQVMLGSANVKFPNSAGTSGQLLQTDGSGNSSWVTIATAQDPEIVAMHYFSIANADTRALTSDKYTDTAVANAVTLALSQNGAMLQSRSITSDWASVNDVTSIVILGSFLYALMRDSSNNYRLYRYTKSDLSLGGTLMTVSGQSFSTTGGAGVDMSSDNTSLYFTNKAGNSANDYIISRYSISGTTITYVSDITCGSTSGNFTGFTVDTSGNLYGMSSSSVLRKYNSSGTLQATSSAYGNIENSKLSRLNSSIYNSVTIVDSGATTRRMLVKAYTA